MDRHNHPIQSGDTQRLSSDPHARWVSIAHVDPHVCCAECWHWINSLLHWNHMVFGPELIKRRHSSLHRSLSINPPFVEYDQSTWYITCLLCRVPMTFHFSPPLNLYGVGARNAKSSELCISSIIEYRSAVRWVWSIHMPVEYRCHMLSHMYVVQSADAHANLSSIEIIWCLGKNCTSVGTVHIIGHWVSIHMPIEYDRSRWVWSIHMPIEYDRSRWVWSIHMPIEYDRSRFRMT
jgi:hypothetical protein